MLRLRSALLFLALLTRVTSAAAQSDPPLKDRVVEYFTQLLRIDTTNPPGNETRAAEYMKRIVEAKGITPEFLGPNPARQNFVARIKGSGGGRPLLLMAHSDVVPADRTQWTVDPFAALTKAGVIYGRGAEDDKPLLAAELAVFVELLQKHTRLKRDVILLSESDEEAGSSGITWMVQNAYPKIDAEFALNEFSYYFDTPSGTRLFQIQTAEKIPTRVKLTAKGTAGHGSLPRVDNPVLHLTRAVTRLADAEQPVTMNATTRAYFAAIAKLPDYAWLKPLLPKLEDPAQAIATAGMIRERDGELNAMLRTTISPTMLQAGVKINVIPNSAEAQLDVRRLPTESKEEVYARMKRIINDDAVLMTPAGGEDHPATEPSALTSPLYLTMQKVFQQSSPKALVVPFEMRGTTDGAFLRAKGMGVYGVPLFSREGELRMHGNDERLSVANLQHGAEMLWQIVTGVAGE